MQQPKYLTTAQIDSFYQNGYLVIPKFLSPEEINPLITRAKELLDDFNTDNHPLITFTTGDDNHIWDDYFLASGDKIRYFLEEDAINSEGKLVVPKEKSVNKIGHALHELDPVFHKVTLENQGLKDLVTDLKFHKDPVVPQSMLIFKQPNIGGEVVEHNDSTFLYTEPPTALGFWIALEECTETNGALCFLPGSHVSPITKRFVRIPDSEKGTGFVPLHTPKESTKSSSDDYVLVTCNPGDLVLIHGSVLHKSNRNRSPRTRFAYTFHMIDSPPHAVYDNKNWLQQSKDLPFSKVLT